MNLDEMKNDTARKNAIREKIANVIYNAMVTEFGEENVVAIPYAITPSDEEGNTASKIDGGSVAVCVGMVTDKNGASVDAVSVISPTVKAWNEVVDKKGRKTIAVNLYDIITANEVEITERKEKEEKKKKKEEGEGS